jgi:diguanylate cyclase (GGDEF)-like protein/PAS domain S-box-containing protein
MRLSKHIPELGRVLQKWSGSVSDAKSLRTAMYAALGGVNALAVCAASVLPLRWYTIAPIACAALAWNLLLAMSICKQIDIDQANIKKNRNLFVRFQNINKYFESVLQDTSDIIISLDRDYLVVKFNMGAQTHFGYGQFDILGKPFEMLFANPADKERMQPPDDGGVKPASAEVPMKTKDGRIITVNMCVSKMRDGGFVVTAQDITEKKYLEEQLKHKSEQLNRLSITDDLTGLFNSRHFYNEIKSELSRLKRHSDRKLAIVYLDVDNFKEYNDTEGHQMGDNVLRALGEVIHACIRKDVDAGFRYGGDEFVIILPDTDMAQAKVAAERIQRQFVAYRFGDTNLSIGIADAREGDNDKTLVRRADFAMYASKKSGKGKITMAEGDAVNGEKTET